MKDCDCCDLRGPHDLCDFNKPSIFFSILAFVAFLSFCAIGGFLLGLWLGEQIHNFFN